MFWGCSIKEGQTYKTQSALEQNDFPVLHLSNVALPRNAGNGKVHLLASMGKDLQDLVIATLQKDKVETVKVDLYFNVSQNVTLSIGGQGELHLSGFFEPQRDELDENMLFDGEDDEDEEEEEVEESENKSLKQAKLNALKNAKGGAPAAKTVAEDDDDEDDDEDDEDEEDEDEDEEDDESEDLPPAKTA